MLSQLLRTASEQASVPLAKIRTDGGTQMRAALDEDTVEQYMEAMRAHGGWGEFPAAVIYYDGSQYWLADGFHRVEALRRLDAMEVNVLADVRSGERRDAILHAASANSTHGLRRTHADKRRSVETLLRDSDWSSWSDREIARRCAVGHQLVARLRAVLASLDENPVTEIEQRTYTTRHGTTATMRTAAINAERSGEQRVDAPLTDAEANAFLNAFWRSASPGVIARICRAAHPILSMRNELDMRVIGKHALVHAEYPQRYLYLLERSRISVWRAAEIGSITPTRQPDTVWTQAELAERSLPIVTAMQPHLMPDEARRAAWRGSSAEPAPSSAASLLDMLRSLSSRHTAADIRSAASFRGGTRWFEARQLLQAAGIRYRDRELIDALNALADEMEQRQSASGDAAEPQKSMRVLSEADMIGLLRPVASAYYAGLEPAIWAEDLRSAARSLRGALWRRAERVLAGAGVAYTTAVVANLMRALANESGTADRVEALADMRDRYSAALDYLRSDGVFFPCTEWSVASVALEALCGKLEQARRQAVQAAPMEEER